MDRRDKKERLLERTAEVFDLPGDLVAGLLRVELTGSHEVRMENHRGILAYGSEEIHVSGGKLVARVRAVLRRTEQKQETEDYRVGDLFVSPQRHVVRVAGEEVALTNKEFELLCLLLEHQGIAMTRDAIMDGVWGQEFSRENRTLDVHVRTLRTKLGPAGHYIETVRGVGYKIGGQA